MAFNTFAPSTKIASAKVNENFQNAVHLTDEQTVENKTFPSFILTGSIQDANGNEILKVGSVASAVNYLKVTNSITNEEVLVEVDGDDTNADLHIKGKGTGKVYPALKAARVAMSGNVTLTTATLTDLTGASVTFTLPVACNVLVTAIFDVQATTANGAFNGFLNVDGANETPIAFAKNLTNNERVCVSQTWLIALAAGSHTLKLQGRNENALGQLDITQTNTGFTYLVISQ